MIETALQIMAVFFLVSGVIAWGFLICCFIFIILQGDL